MAARSGVPEDMSSSTCPRSHDVDDAHFRAASGTGATAFLDDAMALHLGPPIRGFSPE
ncbi:MAG: hypothetical protein H6711_12490 [Myxococcales bacterium]|nr:hypothetical protein [Myxococcales bacterium]